MAKNVTVRLGDIEDAIFDGITNSRELRKVFNDFVEDVHRTWIEMWEISGPHPYETGDYVRHIKMRKIPWRAKAAEIWGMAKHGIPIGQVYNDSDVAHFVEYGTDADRPGTHSKYGRFTPTPEFAPMRRTLARFMGGHLQFTHMRPTRRWAP